MPGSSFRQRPIPLIAFIMITLFFVSCGPATAVPTRVPTAVLPVLDTPAPTPLPPTATLLPSATPSLPPQPTLPPNTVTPIPPTATQTASLPTVLPTATAVSINNITPQQFIQMNADVKNNVRAIYQLGQSLGRNPHAFSKLGDSGVLTGHYLTRFDYPPNYEMGPYAELQAVIDYFKNSFERYGVAARVGLSSWGVLDPLWADETWCRPNEHMLACEFRLHNPAIMFIRLGTNDATSAAVFEKNLTDIVIYAMSEGVIPVLTTKADRFEGDDDRNNEVIRRVAAAYQLPLWDFDLIAATLPNRGLTADNVHLSTADSNDYSNPETLTKGYPANDLSALFVLQAILETVAEEAQNETLPQTNEVNQQ